jgi:hypothetical protein
MSFNMDLYSIDKVEVEHADVKTFLRVLFEGYLLGTTQTYAEAYDIMEAHAQRNPILSAEELSQEVVYEREILHLEEKVEYLTSERDYWKGFTTVSADVTKAVDEERKRSWNENKAFQWDLAEQNAELRKKLTEKHDDNARLQRQLAEGHNKLREAYTCYDDLEESTLSAQVRMSNAEVKVDDLTEENAILRRQVERYEDDVYKRQHDMYANSK